MHILKRKFSIPKGIFNSDKKVISKLEKTAELIAEIYSQQIDDRYPGANFYPHDTTSLEIEQAAKENPSILDPYTVVERHNGRLETIPFHVKYEKELKKISQIIIEAANVSNSPAFNKYLKICATSLVDGTYDRMHAAWMKTRSSINFVIGPIEYYDDRLFSRKRSYQVSIGVVNKQRTQKTSEMKDILYINAKDNIEVSHHSVIDPDKVQVVVENTIATGGFLSRTLFSGEYFPNDFNLLHKTGVKIVFYYPSLILKFEKLHYPIFKAIFSKEFQRSYSKELLSEATFLYIVLYELARQLHHFGGADERLQDLFPSFEEGNTSVSAIQHCKHLLTKGVIDQKTLEALMIIHICWMFSDWFMSQGNPAMSGYVEGSTIVLNFYFKSGALSESGGISWPNFPKMFFEIEGLSNILIKMLVVGDHQQALEFVKKYGSMDYFNRFASRLEGVNIV